MEGTAPEESINPVGKESAEIVHAERIVEEELKSEAPTLTRAQMRRFMIQCDLRVLSMLGVIYAVSILDRINVRRPLPGLNLSRPDNSNRSAQRKFSEWKKTST